MNWIISIVFFLVISISNAQNFNNRDTLGKQHGYWVESGLKEISRTGLYSHGLREGLWLGFNSDSITEFTFYSKGRIYRRYVIDNLTGNKLLEDYIDNKSNSFIMSNSSPGQQAMNYKIDRSKQQLFRNDSLLQPDSLVLHSVTEMIKNGKELEFYFFNDSINHSSLLSTSIYTLCSYSGFYLSSKHIRFFKIIENGKRTGMGKFKYLVKDNMLTILSESDKVLSEIRIDFYFNERFSQISVLNDGEGLFNVKENVIIPN